jgi:hypothetical protein
MRYHIGWCRDTLGRLAGFGLFFRTAEVSASRLKEFYCTCIQLYILLSIKEVLPVREFKIQ